MPRKEETPTSPEIPFDIIQKRAYQIWEREGFPSDRQELHWLQAQDELLKTLTDAPKPKKRRARSSSAKSQRVAAALA